MTIERTLVLIKPDGVQRGLVGEILTRFEKAGLKIVGMKMKWADPEFAKLHYTEDITIRRGEAVRNMLVDFISSGPVVAFVLEGIHAIEIVRKIVGATEPRAATPGTIRADYAHVSYKHADVNNIAVKNLIHASSDENDAKAEVSLWFTDEELHSYPTVHDVHIFQ